MGLVLGESLGTKSCVFSGKVAPAGDERYLLRAALAARIVLTCDWFRTWCGLQGALCVLVCVTVIG